MSEKTPAQLEAENATLTARVAELELQERLAKISRTIEQIRMAKTGGMPVEAVQDLVNAVPDSVVADLKADAVRGNPITHPSSMLPDRGRAQVEIRGSGWQPECKLEPPPGVWIMDRLMDMQDAIDKADLERRLARSAKSKE
jgi:hypothetical protein